MNSSCVQISEMKETLNQPLRTESVEQRSGMPSGMESKRKRKLRKLKDGMSSIFVYSRERVVELT